MLELREFKSGSRGASRHHVSSPPCGLRCVRECRRPGARAVPCGAVWHRRQSGADDSLDVSVICEVSRVVCRIAC